MNRPLREAIDAVERSSIRLDQESQKLQQQEYPPLPIQAWFSGFCLGVIVGTLVMVAVVLIYAAVGAVR